MIIDRLNDVVDYLKKYQINACTFSLMMKGILKDQSSHYLGTYEEIQYITEQKGQLVAEALTLATNFTITAPLED